MKIKYFLITLIIISVKSLNAQTWTQVAHHPDIEFSDIEFLNINEGFIFGDSSLNGIDIGAVVMKTTDGGQSWATYMLNDPDYSNSKAFFLNSNEGFIAGRYGGGNNGFFIKSTDGGLT